MVIVVDPEEEAGDLDGVRRRKALVKLYIAGDQLGDTMLRNSVMDYLIHISSFSQYNMGEFEIKLAFTRLPEGSKLRAFIVHECQRWPDQGWLKEIRERLPSEFFVDLALHLMGLQEQQPRLPTRCTFHDHDAEVPRCIGPR